MPAPIIRKISGLHKRIVGLTNGSQPGTTSFNPVTNQNIHKHLQDGIGGTSIGSDFQISDENGWDQDISKLFDNKDETSVTIKHNNKDQWILFDLGKNRDLDRIIIENGPTPGGGTNVSHTLDTTWYFWKAGQNPITDTAEAFENTPDIPHADTTEIKVDLSNNNLAYQYVGLRIVGIPLNYNQVATPGGTTDGYLNFKNFAIYESFDTRDYIVEFDDSLLDMHSWTGMRYKGCKTTGKKINEYNGVSDGAQGVGNIKIGTNFTVGEYPPLEKYIGDLTYGKTAVIENKTTALYITNTIVGGTEDEDVYAKIKNHSYINIDKILIINLNDDTVKILDRETEDFESFHRYVTTDFPTVTGKFNLKILDNYIQNNLKTEYNVKMNKGWLLKSFEYNSERGPLPAMDKDKITELNTTSQDSNNVRFTVTNPLSLYDAISGSIQQPFYQPNIVGIDDGPLIYGYNFPLNEDSNQDPLSTGIPTGLYGCQQGLNNRWCANKDLGEMESGIIKDLYDVFSYGPFYGTTTINNVEDVQGGIDATNSALFTSIGSSSQHAGGDLRFRFGVTNLIDDLATSTGIPNQGFFPLYTGDNTRFIDNKFTREFIKQENNSTLGVKNFILPNIEQIEAKTGLSFSNWVKDNKANPSVTASLFIGQCVQYLNSHSQDTELHLTLFEGTKDFSGQNDEMSIGTFEVDRNVNPGYLDFADNLGKLYNTVGPRAKYIKLKNSPQFRPTVQPVKFDRYVYDTIETSEVQILTSERQNSFVFGPGSPVANTPPGGNTGLSISAGHNHIGTSPGQKVATYDNSSGNSDNYSGSFQYEISFLDKDHTLITDLDKSAELFDGIGGAGAVLIPEHTHEAVKINLYYYLQKAGLIDRTTVKKRVKPI